jgi:DNA primase
MSRPPEPRHRPEGQEEHQRKLAALRTRLHEDAPALNTPADWARCLRLAALMPGEDFANVLLVSAQRPGAVMVADYRQWTAMGRQVRRGEKGIEVFAVPPRQRPQARGKQHDEEEPGWRDATRIAHVWDLPQTTGQPPAVPVGLPALGPVPAGLRDALCWLARREGFAVEQEHGVPADGTTFWTARRIRLPSEASEDQTVWALAHQLGHVLLRHGDGLPPGTTTSGCAGARKSEADSVAFIVCARHGVPVAHELAHPSSWAGRDPRAQPAAIILAAGQRITAAAARITRHTGRLLRGDDSGQPATSTEQPAAAHAHSPASSPAVATSAPPAARQVPAGPSPRTRRVLQHAQDFYTAQLPVGWAPAYLTSRGISAEVAAEWGIGYAPAGWTTLTDHLRRLGHGDDDIEAAGLAKRSTRGTPIDRFRDRVMVPVHDEHGELAGFIGRAHPNARPDIPKYLNSPETAGYKKGSLLFGLHRARQALAHGATPVIVEGPFDAIAVTLADPAQHAGLAPCGTALTTQQASLLSQAADLPRTGILVAFDSDPAGRKAAARAYGILRPHTWKLQSALLNAKDPAQIVQQDGPAALRSLLREHREPLSAVVIDTHLEGWKRHLGDTEGRFRAMHSTASLIAKLLPADATSQVRRLTGGRDMKMLDDMLRPVENPQLPQIARTLPTDAACQVVRAACALDFGVSDVLAEVANAANRSARSPKGQHRARREGPIPACPDRGPGAPILADGSFPESPFALDASTSSAEPLSRAGPPASRLRPARRSR